MATQFWTTAQAKSVGNTVVLSFPQPVAPTVWVGTVSVPLSPPGAEWHVMLGGIAVATIVGRSQYGPIALGPGEQLTLAGSRVVAGTTYKAVLVGQRQVTPQVAIPTPTALTPSLLLSSLGTLGTTVRSVHGTQASLSKAAGPYRIWNWGWFILTAGAYATGLISLSGGTPLLTIDVLQAPYQSASNRPGGVLVSTARVTSEATASSGTIESFILYSPASS